MRYQHLATTIVVAATAISSPAAAQGAGNQPAPNSGDNASGVEVIVVTAQKRSENLQNVPITVNAYSSKQLTAFNVTTAQDLSTLVSGFNGAGLDNEQSPHIRGVGVTSAQQGEEGSVATYVDGVYIGATGSPGMMNLQDATDVEVLKGPMVWVTSACSLSLVPTPQANAPTAPTVHV